jgi:hypothetical protein
MLNFCEKKLEQKIEKFNELLFCYKPSTFFIISYYFWFNEFLSTIVNVVSYEKDYHQKHFNFFTFGFKEKACSDIKQFMIHAFTLVT